VVHGGDFGGVRDNGLRRIGPDHDWRDQIAGAGRIIVEQAEHGILIERETKLFPELAQCRLHLRLAGIAAAARQGPLRAMTAQARGTPRQQESGIVSAVRGGTKRNRDGGAFQLARLARIQACESRAETFDIPPRGIAKGFHPNSDSAPAHRSSTPEFARRSPIRARLSRKRPLLSPSGAATAQ
jgi:hypothetical protein